MTDKIPSGAAGSPSTGLPASRSSSEQARMDAMADAATLEQVARASYSNFYKTNIFRAREAGIMAESALVYGGGWINAAVFATKAAKAAFKAVPGLRA